jgi:hypothetical protein
MTIYDPDQGSHKQYVVAPDRTLRESEDLNSPRLPTFRHTSRRRPFARLNVFLVILNAEIKFRRYFEMIRSSPPPTPLPADVLDVMRSTIILVDLIYWRPIPLKGTKGYAHLVNREPLRRETGWQRVPLYDSDDDPTRPSVRDLARTHARVKLLLEGDLETRRANCSALMSGHGMYLHFPSISAEYHWF